MSVEEDVMKIQKKLTKMTSDDGTVSGKERQNLMLLAKCFYIHIFIIVLLLRTTGNLCCLI